MNCCIKRDLDSELHDAGQKIPRPPNAFMLYANENRKAMAQRHPTESNKEISKRLGNSWKSLELEEKNKYFDRAKFIDMEHKKRYPNYVYNPKEARIRKAMREATRDRSIGASPMLPRPSARRPSHWIPTHEDQLMLNPLASMRAAMSSPICNFPITGGSSSSQYITPISSYSKIEPQMPATSIHGDYIQTNPLAQLQQQTEMWHAYQDNIRPRSSGSMQPSPVQQQQQQQPLQQSPQQPPHQQVSAQSESPVVHPPEAIPDPAATSGISSSPNTPHPPGNENIPPANSDGVESMVHQGAIYVRDKELLEPMQPLMDSANLSQGEQYLSVFNDSAMRSPYEKADKIKKHPNQQSNLNILNMEEIYLPLSSYTFPATPDLLTDNMEYHRKYIIKYFESLPEYDLFDVTGADEQSFPYVTLSTRECGATGPSGQQPTDPLDATPSFIPTDIGYIPFYEDVCEENAINLSNIPEECKAQKK